VEVKIEKKCEQTRRIEKIKTHLVGNKFAGEKGAKQKSRIARSGNGDDEFSAFPYFFLRFFSPI